MAAPGSRSSRAGARLGLALLAAILLAWLLASAVADVLVRTGHPDAALKLGASHSALEAIASRQLAARDAEGAARAARAALRLAPLSPRSVRTLGLAEQALGRREEGAQLLSLGAQLGWRDRPTLIWLASAAAGAGDAAHAALYLDAIGRSAPASLSALSFIDSAAADAQVRAALADRLALRPVWRHTYFLYANRLDASGVASVAAMLAALRATAAPATRDEVAPLVLWLLRGGDPEDAHAVWRRFAADPKLARAVYDGGFDQAPGNPPVPFEWSLSARSEGSAEIGDGPGGRRALHARATGIGSATIAAQSLSLTPGVHRLSFSLMPVASGGADGFRWAVACDGGAPVEMGRLPASEPGRWSRASLAFVVPAGCRLPALMLRAEETVLPDEHELWLDDVQVDGG